MNRAVVVGFQTLLNTCFPDDESSSDSDDPINPNLLRDLISKQKVTRVQHYFEVTIPRYSDKEFQTHFRLTRGCCERLINLIGHKLGRPEGPGKPQIEIEKQILSVIWLLGNPESYRSVGDRFNMAKGSLFWCFIRVVEALNSIAPDVIKWPNMEQRILIKNKFENISGIPGIIGAIDGTYVPIKAPKEHPEQYINRKCFHAITLQAIASVDLKFIDCFAGFPSSVNDVRVFRNSPIYHAMVTDRDQFLSQNEFLIGDKAYPLTTFCISPYIDRGNLNASQVHFNIKHAKARQVVERSFALLFGRFRRIKNYLDMSRMDLVPKTVIACCVLHNICLLDTDALQNLYTNEGADREDEVEHQENLNNEFHGNPLRDRIAIQLYEEHLRV